MIENNVAKCSNVSLYIMQEVARYRRNIVKLATLDCVAVAASSSELLLLLLVLRVVLCDALVRWVGGPDSRLRRNACLSFSLCILMLTCGVITLCVYLLRLRSVLFSVVYFI